MKVISRLTVMACRGAMDRALAAVAAVRARAWKSILIRIWNGVASQKQEDREEEEMGG